MTTQLAEHYQGTAVSEYARSYVEHSGGKYQFRDVEHIAKTQIRQIQYYHDQFPVIFDTGLIITKVWFLEVYDRMPDWLDQKIAQYGKGVYLLCEPDLKWMADPVRENKDKREYLYGRYLEEIESYGFPVFSVNGNGNARFENARSHIDAIFGALI